MALHRYRPTHLRPGHRARRWGLRTQLGLVVGSALLCVLFVLWAGGALGGRGSWSAEEQKQISAQRAAATEPKVEISGESASYKADKKTKNTWLTSIPTPGPAPLFGKRTLPKASFKLAEIQSWVQEKAYSENHAPSPQIEENYADGTFKRLTALGKPGKEVSNVARLSEEIYRAISAGKSYAGKFTYSTIAPGSRVDRTDQSLQPVYAAQPGQRWIEVDLKNNTTSAWESNKLVYGPIASVAGHRLAPTVRGVFKTYLKVPQQVMRGVGYDGPYSENAPWIMYFHGDFALHAAPWRENFFYTPDTGSHGCVNLPTGTAKWLYDWAPLGTTVVVHD